VTLAEATNPVLAGILEKFEADKTIEPSEKRALA
jgi:hypothetical protein